MRVKRGFASRRRHKRILKLAKGFQGRRKNCFRIAKDAVERAMQYAYRDRKAKKRDFRKIWITRINAAARIEGLSYSRLMNGLRLANVEVDRKMLADIALRDPNAFSDLAKQAQGALSQGALAQGAVAAQA